jgi:predicted branched-subunit amino acid permease
MSNPMHDVAAGARAMAPWLAGVAPFGLVIGIAAARADFPTVAGWLTAPLIFGASAQIAAIQLLDAGATAATVVLTVLVINLRLVLYSAAMARYWRGTPLWWRLLGAYLLIDPSFVVGTERYAVAAPGQDRRRGHAHYLGGGLLLWVGWLAAVAIGATAGARIPESLHLELLVPLYLLGEIVPRLRDLAPRRTALTSALVGLVCLNLPLHLGIVVAIVAGLAVGGATLRRTPPARPAARASTSEPDTAQTLEVSS